MWKPRFCLTKRARLSPSYRRRVEKSQRRAPASMMRRHLRPPKMVSRWVGHGRGNGERRRHPAQGSLTGLVRARRLSQATMRNIRQNLFFAFAYNAAGVAIAAGVLYPTLGLLLSSIVTAAAMALSTASVVGNALRLRTVRI
jgi:hypothetical protein